MRIVALITALACGTAWADQSCTELLDGGTPAPAVKLPAGTVLEQPAWVVTPARMCAVGQALQSCQASSGEASSSRSTGLIIVSVVAGLFVGSAAAVGLAAATGHLK